MGVSIPTLSANSGSCFTSPRFYTGSKGAYLLGLFLVSLWKVVWQRGAARWVAK
jgi:hypothetical protein